MTKIYFLIAILSLSLLASSYANEAQDTVDTDLYFESIDVTAIKQGVDIAQQPLSATLLTRSLIDAQGVSDLKKVSAMTPNFYMPDYGSRTTSSIYVRGLGARIDNPVVGLTIDNVPIMNKDNFDFEMADVERIEVLRGPQSAMYGRNTMAGVINVYTISPFNYQGVRASIGYGSANTYKMRVGYYDRNEKGNFAYAISGYYTQKDGFWTNAYNDEKLDWEKLGGGRLRLQWRGADYSIDNTTSFSILEQGGYPYMLVGADEVNYNDPSSFERTNFTNGLTIAKKFDKFELSSITSYQYTDNCLDLDNDFTAYDYFTLRQAVSEHTLTQDLIVSSVDSDNDYQWLFGGFGFYEASTMSAPVTFQRYGIDNIILAYANTYNPQYNYEWQQDELVLASDFELPTYGLSLYHKSSYTTGRWSLSAQLRLDYEKAGIEYRNYVKAYYNMVDKNDSEISYNDRLIDIDNDDKLTQSFVELLPKLSVAYSLKDGGSLYATFAKGYKAGGFNTQMFSDVLQQQLMNKMGVGATVDTDDIITYKPEYSWNYELGGKFLWPQKAAAASFALFYIDCRDQQLTVFPDEMIAGRMMTNAGRTRSFGAEVSLAKSFGELNLAFDYGYTNAKFVEYDDGEQVYDGNYIPYAPMHTLSARADYAVGLGKGRSLVFGLSLRAVGEIYWEENNSLYEPFYGLLDANISYLAGNYSVILGGRNLTGTDYNTFYFESIGNSFVQKGNPRSLAITLNLNI